LFSETFFTQTQLFFMDDIIQTDDDLILDLAKEVRHKIETKRQICLTYILEEHRQEHPYDDPGVTRRLAEVEASGKVGTFLSQALAEVITPQLKKEVPALHFRVLKLVKEMLPQPIKKKYDRKSKRKTKAELRAEMDEAGKSLTQGTLHGEMCIPGVMTRKILPSRPFKKGIRRKWKARKAKVIGNEDDWKNPPILTAAQINKAVQIAQERYENIKRDFPGPPPNKPGKTIVMNFMSAVPKAEGRPRKNWRKEVGI
jgi:hypothetical protein